MKLCALAGDDPVNETDPTGLCSIFGNCWSEAANDVEGAAKDVGHFVAQHKVAIGIGVGVLAAATGVGAVIDGSVLLAAGSAALAAAGTAADYSPCIHGGDSLACVGLAFNGVGFVSSGLSAAALAFGGESASYLFAGLGLNFGLAGLTTDLSGILIGANADTVLRGVFANSNC